MEKNFQPNNTKAIIFAASAAILWSTVATAFKLALKNYSELEMLLYSSLSSFIVLSIFGVFNSQFISSFKVSIYHHTKSMILGALNPFIYYLVLFKAYNLLPAQEAQTLNYTWSIMVVIFSFFLLKQKIRFLNIVAILISFSGVIVIASKGDLLAFRFENSTGIMLALGSSIFWALYWIINIGDKRAELKKLILNFFYGTNLVSIYSIFSLEGLSKIDTNILYCVYIGIFEMGITFILWMYALKYAVNTAKVSNIIYLSPFLSLFWINLFIGESIKYHTIIGLILIIAGIIIQSLIKSNRSVA